MTTESSSVLPMSPDVRLMEMPYLVTKIVLGAESKTNYREKEELVSVEWGGQVEVIHSTDFDLAKELATNVTKEWGRPSAKIAELFSPKATLEIHRFVHDKLLAMVDHRKGRRGLVMLRDPGGCGWWRMTFPARYMSHDGWYVDITTSGLSFDALMEYHTIFVQRIYNWEQFYILQKLKEAGKKIIYDIDDDIFHIPPHNNASDVIGRDQMMSAIACMNLADVVVTTTSHLVSVLREADVESPIEIIPNAVDLKDGWLHTSSTGSPDDKQRIFWAGSDTHGVDWNECLDVVSQVMDNRKNVLLVIIGACPNALASRASRWPGRVENMLPMEPETYYRILKHVRADVGLLPLADNFFNRSKSPLKFIEYAMIGIPSVASDAQPYNGIITHEENGFLAKTKRDWRQGISKCLDNSKVRRDILSEARKTTQAHYDINNVASKWEKILFS